MLMQPGERPRNETAGAGCAGGELQGELWLRGHCFLPLPPSRETGANFTGVFGGDSGGRSRSHNTRGGSTANHVGGGSTLSHGTGGASGTNGANGPSGVWGAPVYVTHDGEPCCCNGGRQTAEEAGPQSQLLRRWTTWVYLWGV